MIDVVVVERIEGNFFPFSCAVVLVMQDLRVLESKAGRAEFRQNGRSETWWRTFRGFSSGVLHCGKQSFDTSCRLYNSSSSSCPSPSTSSGHCGCQLESAKIRARRRPWVCCIKDENPTSTDFLEAEVERIETSYFSSVKTGNGSPEKPVSAVQELQRSANSLMGSPDLKFIVDNLMRIPAWADALTERGMQRRRTFYSQDDWVRHRSSTRHYRHFQSSFSSRAILSLIPPVGTMTLVAAAVALFNSIVLAGWLPSFIPVFHASALPYQLTAPALALLLVFRTEASYSRYDEARKTWTKVISSSKDIARQSMAWIQHPADSHHKKLLLDYVLAFPIALKCHLLYGSNIAEELKDILEEDDLELVLSSEHRPNCLIQLITHSLKCVEVEEGERSLLDENIRQFNDSISVCERLIRTPIPLAYTRLTSRFLVLWHLTLPVVLWDDCHWMVVPATFISAASLFCIEEVGVLIEEPFPILALDRMCAKAQENIQELADLQKRAQVHLKSKTGKFQSNGVSIGATRL